MDLGDGHVRSTAGNGDLPRVRLARKSYEQVSDHLRELITSGTLPVGARLPTEAELGEEFSVSRATIREALRLLTAERLVVTVKGLKGHRSGSYVAAPRPDYVSDFLRQSIGLLTDNNEIDVDDLFEVRELLETRAVELAVARATDDDLVRMQNAVPCDLVSDSESFHHNRDFHFALLAAAGNVLIDVAAQPLFSIIHARVNAAVRDETYQRRVRDEHAEILEAIRARDAVLAAQTMRSHLRYLQETMRPAWRTAS